MKDQILSTAVELAVPVIAACIAWLSARLVSYLKSKTKSELLKAAMSVANDSILTLVREAEQTIVADLKARKKKGGGLTKAEAVGVKKTVLASFRKLWGTGGQAKLIKALGISADALTQYVEAKIEESVKLEKKG